MMRTSKLSSCILCVVLLLCFGCGGSIRITPDTPLVARGFDGYLSKRAVVLAFRAPDLERELGTEFAAVLHRELLARGPFAQVAFHPEADATGLQSPQAAELARAAFLGSELGFDLAIFGAVERFVYSRNSDSILELSVWFLDTVTGEVIHAERLSARGKAGSAPPVWAPSLSSAPERERIMAVVAAEVVRRINKRWD